MNSLYDINLLLSLRTCWTNTVLKRSCLFLLKKNAVWTWHFFYVSDSSCPQLSSLLLILILIISTVSESTARPMYGSRGRGMSVPGSSFFIFTKHFRSWKEPCTKTKVGEPLRYWPSVHEAPRRLLAPRGDPLVRPGAHTEHSPQCQECSRSLRWLQGEICK